MHQESSAVLLLERQSPSCARMRSHSTQTQEGCQGLPALKNAITAAELLRLSQACQLLEPPCNSSTSHPARSSHSHPDPQAAAAAASRTFSEQGLIEPEGSQSLHSEEPRSSPLPALRSPWDNIHKACWQRAVTTEQVCAPLDNDPAATTSRPHLTLP